MWKIASDIVNRIFEYLPNVEGEKSLTKELLTRCFMHGKSNAKISKRISKGYYCVDHVIWTVLHVEIGIKF